SPNGPYDPLSRGMPESPVPDSIFKVQNGWKFFERPPVPSGTGNRLLNDFKTYYTRRYGDEGGDVVGGNVTLEEGK
ncbi:hypothetical protein, partial [Cohnella fermenti]|uniref:hypothetical protein n=1 Tax=Cohnella fermenti TaxID=2565925 RepID=UPI001B3B22A8